MTTTTLDVTEQDEEDGGGHEEHPPGLVMVAVAARPVYLPFSLSNAVLLGRSDLGRSGADDERMSRRHAEITWEGSRYRIRDLASRNGTFVDGVRVRGEVLVAAPRVLRLGRTLLSFVRDVGTYQGVSVTHIDGALVGPRLREAWDRVERVARASDSLVVTGESGAGKELAARLFHRSGPGARGPFVAVNCAAIPQSIAERLLFGAQKGAYSGATADSEGMIQAAHGGTLFLDEVAELDLGVQAKLLRVLETREVTPLGSSKPRALDLRIVCATHRDLRRQVAAREFRDDLYFRLGGIDVNVPPLRDRLEEVPFLVADAVAEAGSGKLSVHPLFLETCLLRRWPGNVRELRSEVARAAQEALAAGRDVVEPSDLSEDAGREISSAPTSSEGEKTLARTDDATIERVLREVSGNVSQAARELGIHRNQLRRWIARNRGS